MTQPAPVEVVGALYATVEAADHAGTRGLLAPDLRWRQAASVAFVEAMDTGRARSGPRPEREG